MARYRHPKHGYCVASYGDDIAALKAAGWVADDPALAPAPPPIPAPEPAVQSEIVPEVPRRRGRYAK